jgi:hypothetical protein
MALLAIGLLNHYSPVALYSIITSSADGFTGNWFACKLYKKHSRL